MFNFKNGDLDYLIRLYEEEGEFPKNYNYKRPISELVYKNSKYKQRAEFYVDNAIYSIPINDGVMDINSFFNQYEFTLMELVGFSKSMFNKYSSIIIDNREVKDKRYTFYQLKKLSDISKLPNVLKKNYEEVNTEKVYLYINGYTYNLNYLMENIDHAYNIYLERKQEELKLKEEAKLERENLI